MGRGSCSEKGQTACSPSILEQCLQRYYSALTCICARGLCWLPAHANSASASRAHASCHRNRKYVYDGALLRRICHCGVSRLHAWPAQCGHVARRFISGGSEQAALLITLEQDDQEADYGRICAEHRQDVLAVSSDLGDAVLQARPPARVIWVRLLQKLTKAVLAVGGAAGSASAPAATRFAVVVVLQDVSLGLHRPA